MKKLLLSSAAIVAFAGSALAADLPSRKAAPEAPAVPLWTGFYAGLNAGYNFGTNSNVMSGTNFGSPLSLAGAGFIQSYSPNAPVSLSGSASNTQSGFIGGAQFGYNYQGFWSKNLVIGIETDIQGSNSRGTSQTKGLSSQSVNGLTGNAPGTAFAQTGFGNETGSGSSVVQGGLDYLGTVRGRIGYLWTPTLLVYGTGGFAYGGAWASVGQSAIATGSLAISVPAVPINITNAYSNTWIGGGHQSQLLTGWTAGGGLEWMFMPNWSLKGEATYWDLGRMNIQTTAYTTNAGASSIASGRTSVSYSGVQAKAGINYHFTWGSVPVVASF